MNLSACERSAFSLVEVALALGVAALCLLAIFGLLPTGISANQAAVQETMAANLITAIVADLRATPAASTNSQIYQVPLPGNATFYLSEDGQAAPSPNSRSRFRCMTISVAAPGNTATCLRILISWPPAINPTVATPEGKLESYVALDR